MLPCIIPEDREKQLRGGRVPYILKKANWQIGGCDWGDFEKTEEVNE